MSSESQGLRGLRVLSLESRRVAEMARLIEGHGGVAISAPSMREVPLEENPQAIEFARQLLENRYDAVIFLTGVGTRLLFDAVERQFPRDRIVEALSRVLVLARGPKPVAALRERGVPIGIAVPEPNTWRDILKSIDDYAPRFDLNGKRVAVQEYGATNREFLESLRARGADVTAVKVYQWDLPEDLGPLRRAVREIAAGRIDVLLVTSATQVEHMMQVAAAEGVHEGVRTGLRRAVIASIGPIASEALESHAMAADFSPSHPKMGQLVFEVAREMPRLLERARSR
jgi:uroporphyrinogen-III synthase